MPTLAELQLRAWLRIAETWPSQYDEDTGVLRCTVCGKGIMLWLDSQGKRYQYTDDQVMALTVLHLRAHHTDLDPDKAL